MARGRELRMAFLAMLLIGGLYAAVTLTSGAPQAGELVGHGLGVIGFVLMLATETLYSLRKRAVRRARGRMSDWLQFHIFTGIVGPYLVLLHTAWSFRGLAGAVTLLTGIVVLSGFIGRYIYTAVPRTSEGTLVEAEELQRQLSDLEAELRPAVDQAGAPDFSRTESGAWWVLSRGPLDLAQRWRRGQMLRRLDPSSREKAKRHEQLLTRQQELRRQLASHSAARRLLATWHTIHIPLGMALFVAAFFHVGAALYFATLQR